MLLLMRKDNRHSSTVSYFSSNELQTRSVYGTVHDLVPVVGFLFVQ